jgi:CYTH domain-containing protein
MLSTSLLDIRASLWAAMSGGKRAMVVSPLELSQAGRMNATSRLLGRVVGIEVTDLLFSCYILCGPTRKHLVQVEAWRELLVPATKLFEEGKLVSITKATLAVRRSDKNKFSLMPLDDSVRQNYGSAICR